jgi:teichuronic acid biosynthesis glycosyltransferase TuaC
MKVLVISHMYPSAPNKAYGIFIHKQVQALIDQGCALKVISPVPYAPWPLPILRKKWKAYSAVPHQDFIDGVEVYYPRYPEFPRSYLLEHSGFLMYRGIRKLVRKLHRDFRFELIQAHVALPDGHAALLLKDEYHLPTVVTIHGQDFQSTIHQGEKCQDRLFQVLKRTDRIITVSSKLKNMVKDEPFFSKITVINNGIDLKDCKPVRVENLKPVKPESKLTEELKIVSVSNLKKTKGLDLNLQALSRLLPKYPQLKYYIVGDGEERQSLESLVADLGLGKQVVFLGKLAHPEALRQIAQGDIFCLPSWQEGFGVVYLEAMAQGVPVIGVRGEGIEDVIIHGQNGLLVRPQNVEDLVQALDSLLRSPEYAKSLAEAGRDIVTNGFTWSHNARSTISIYKSLLAKEGSSAY